MFGLVLLAAGSLAATGRESYQIIVNPGNPTRELSRAFLRDAFLKRSTQWGHGPALRPVDLGARAPAREAFSRDVLGRTVAEVKRYWQQQIFSGKNVPPPEIDSDADLIGYVLRHPGAIGYLPATADPRGARVVPVK
jgi:ABC-type phosphate transport system substrate-binding protein